MAVFMYCWGCAGPRRLSFVKDVVFRTRGLTVNAPRHCSWAKIMEDNGCNRFGAWVVDGEYSPLGSVVQNDQVIHVFDGVQGQVRAETPNVYQLHS
jgi:hypothetical protein